MLLLLLVCGHAVYIATPSTVRIGRRCFLLVNCMVWGWLTCNETAYCVTLFEILIRCGGALSLVVVGYALTRVCSRPGAPPQPLCEHRVTFLEHSHFGLN